LNNTVAEIAHFDRCAQQFEDFCVVSDSVRHGIQVKVEIFDAAGQRVYGTDDSPSTGPNSPTEPSARP
jgi:hypothetical protein